MYIYNNAVPVSEREHIARLWRLIARDIFDCEEKLPNLQKSVGTIDWEAVLGPLHIASSIEALSANTDYVDDTGSVMYCGSVADFEDMHSELMSQHIKELTIFVWVWIAFEKATDLLCDGSARSRAGIAIKFMRKKAGKVRLYGLENVEQRAYELAPPIVRSKVSKTIKNERAFLFIHLCREARNYLLHGESSVPLPKDWGPATEYKVKEDDVVIFVRLLIRLVLFALQTLLFVVFQNGTHRTSAIMDSVGVPRDVLVQDALRVLHLNEKDFDQMQAEFDLLY